MSKYAILPILWAILIAVLCGIPGRDIPHISFLEIISFDKFVHAGIFFVLIVLSLRNFSKNNTLKSTTKYYLLAFGIGYGILLEILQGAIFIERSADIYDVIANSFGCVLATFSFNKLKQIKLLKPFLS
ncbi:MAG: VanZ family protein [Bacteroidota bacterium]